MSDRISIVKSYLSDRITSKEPFASWLNAEGIVTGEFFDNISDMLAQGNVDTATWGLKYWETGLGIVVDESKPYDYRRSAIKSKIRGYGTTTIAMIKNVATSFSNGEVDVIENNSTYSFVIKFTGTLGIPPNMSDLIAATEEIKPAHLSHTFEYSYRTWNMVSSRTWNSLSSYTWDEVREGDIS